MPYSKYLRFVSGHFENRLPVACNSGSDHSLLATGSSVPRAANLEVSDFSVSCHSPLSLAVPAEALDRSVLILTSLARSLRLSSP
ncbi:hypothetical protein PI125_g19206 [Phytophthora idaei]|nr:hypothetical protein PI125_g19206 [Phytophthora idaei]